jgi:hypothetical protein
MECINSINLPELPKQAEESIKSDARASYSSRKKKKSERDDSAEKARNLYQP